MLKTPAPCSEEPVGLLLGVGVMMTSCQWWHQGADGAVVLSWLPIVPWQRRGTSPPVRQVCVCQVAGACRRAP